MMPRVNFYLAATLKDSDLIVGEAVLRLVNPALAQAEIGFGVAAAHRRQGFATEIGRALLQAAFGTFAAHRVAAQTAPENRATLRVLEKLGLAPEGVQRDVAFARGRWWSSAVYARLAEEKS
jgi:RimJ/RimL family protein N-acetyltransferase